MPWPGSWTYDDGKGSQGDNSNTQYALLGLQAAAEANIPVKPEVWTLARQYWEMAQRRGGFDSGSWGYYPRDQQPAGGSMTVAGISSLVISGLRRFEGVEALPERRAADRKSDAERDRDGADVLRSIAGATQPIDSARGLARMEERYGEVGVVAYRWAFGEIWSRPQLSRRDRSIVVIAILVSLGAVAELAVHAPAGLRHGLSRVEVEEIVTHLSLYAGIPRAIEAIGAVRAAWAKLDDSK